MNPRLVREALLLERDWIKKETVHDYRSRVEAEKKGIKPIPLIWVDTNKGDKNAPIVRSRICVRECKKGRNAVESMELEQLFSAMPPLEALKLLCSLKVSLKTSRRGKPFKQAHFVISRAHFMPKARRELYVELPCRSSFAFHVWHARRLELVAGRLHREIGPARLHAWTVQPCSVSFSSWRWPHAGAWR